MTKQRYCTNCHKLIDWYNSPYIENDSGTCDCSFYHYEEYDDVTTIYPKDKQLHAELVRFKVFGMEQTQFYMLPDVVEERYYIHDT